MAALPYSGVIDDATGDVLRAGFVEVGTWNVEAGQTAKSTAADEMPCPSICRGQMGATEMTRLVSQNPNVWQNVPQP